MKLCMVGSLLQEGVSFKCCATHHSQNMLYDETSSVLKGSWLVGKGGGASTTTCPLLNILLHKNNHNLNSVHLKQKKLVRLCTHSRFLAHTNPLFHQLIALNVYAIYKLKVALVVYKFDHGLLTDIFNKYLQKNHKFHTHLTRSADLYRPCN